MSNQKKTPAMSRDMEIQGAKLFGKHISAEKQRALLIVTLIACALPMVLGARFWNQIPEIVPTGLIGPGGKDDSIPRWMIAFGLPGLMCLMEAIAHYMLRLYQDRMMIPPLFNRMMGRWVFPVASVLCCGGVILKTSGQGLSLGFYTPCILGLALLLLGSHMFDCPMTAKVALRFSFSADNPSLWKEIHRFAGWLWMLTGLVVIGGSMFTAGSTAFTAVLVLAALAAPAVYGRTRREKMN